MHGRCRPGEGDNHGIGPSSQGGGVIRSWMKSAKLFTLGEMWRPLG